MTNTSTIHVLRSLFTDFPSQDPTVRLVIILTVFLSCSSNSSTDRTSPPTLKAKFEALGLTPLSRKDIVNVLLNPFIEKYASVIDYAKVEVGLNPKEVRELVEEVAIKCLEIGCKGKMLKRLVDDYPMLKITIATVVVDNYQLSLDDLPPFEDEAACHAYHARLCRDYSYPRVSEPSTHDEAVGSEVMMEDATDPEGGFDEDEMDELDEVDVVSIGGETQEDVPELVSSLIYYTSALSQVLGCRGQLAKILCHG